MERTIDECFFQIQNGANIKQGVVDGGFPITRIETTANDKFNRDRMGYAGITDLDKYESYVLEDGDLLMSHINSVQYLGRTILYEKQDDETIIHGMNLLRLKARRDIINPAYARYCFYANPFRSQVANITKKSVNQASFAVNDLKKIKISVPDIEEQNIVVDKLDIIRKIIEQRYEELEQLDNLIKARFVEMFGDVVLNTKNWENYTWDNVLTIKNGKNQKDVENPKGIYPICGSGGIMNYADDYITESNSVIIGRKGNINNPILMREKFWNVDTAFGLEPNTTVLNVDYLFMFCNFFDFKILNKAVTIPSLTKADLLKIIIPIPPIELQERFADFVAQVDKSKVVVKKALDEAQILFDSLMQKYFG